MSSKTLFGIVVVIIIVGGWLLFNRKSAYAPAPTASPSASALVSPTPAASPTGEFTTIPQSSASPSPLPPPTPSVTTTGPTPTPSPVHQPVTKTVSITSGGFSPTELDISLGDTVKFVNNDSEPHWPASNPHPVHTGTPGFDALKALTTGESYSFTFTALGTVTYHDHLHPSVQSTIRVNPLTI